jgi:hypothetical protein
VKNKLAKYVVPQVFIKVVVSLRKANRFVTFITVHWK